MTSTKNRERFVLSRFFPFFPALLVIAGGAMLLFRDLWFDEALTLLNFAWLPALADIYHNYVIPNNQLLYTALCHGVSQLPLEPGWALRWISLLIAALSLLIVSRKFGEARQWAFPAVMIALALSPMLLIYATAIRGYMLSFLWVALALQFLREWLFSHRRRDFLFYFAAVFGALATIPSNVFSLGGVLLLTLPRFGKNFSASPRFYAAAAALPAAGLLIYLPILPNALKVATLGEGAHSFAAGAGGFLLAVLVGFLPIIPVALAGAWRRRQRYLIPEITVLLMPVIIHYLWKTPPFARTYFPFLLLDALIFTRWAGRIRGRNYQVIFGVVMLVWAIGENSVFVRSQLSEFAGGARQDDCFYPYYMRESHQMRRAIAEAFRVAPDQEKVDIYASFAADPWGLLYYALPEEKLNEFNFDGPRRRVERLAPDTVVILHATEDPELIEKRFGGKLTFRAGCGEVALYLFGARQSKL